MSIVKMSPCVLIPEWSDFIAWAAHVFDIPVACQFDDQGWGRLLTKSSGVTVISGEHFQVSQDGRQTIVEFQVLNIDTSLARAVSMGAKVVSPVVAVGEAGRHAALETPQGLLLWLFQETTTTEPTDVTTTHQGPVHFTVDQTYKATASQVFDAITQAAHLSNFFITGASADLGAGKNVTWSWEDHSADLGVVSFSPNQYVAFNWTPIHQTYLTRTQFNLSSSEAGTKLTITESGWDADPSGMRSSFAHCEGWTKFVSYLLVYLEHDLKLMAS